MTTARLATIPGVEVFASGDYDNGRYTLGDICEIARNVNRLGPDGMGLHTVPLGALNRVGIGHDKDQAIAKALTRSDTLSVGAVKNARVVPYRGPDGEWHGSIFADLYDVPAEVAEAIRQKRLRKVSAELYPDFVDRFGQHYGQALCRVSLLGFAPPVVKGMADLPVPIPQFAERLKLIRVVRTHENRVICFSEYPMVSKEALILAAKGASPETDDGVIATIIDAVLTVVPEAASNGGEPATGDTETMAEDRAGIIAELVAMGQDPAALEAMTDEDLKALYEQLKAGGPAAAGVAMSEVKVKKYAEKAVADAVKTALAPLVKTVETLAKKAQADATKVQQFSEQAEKRDRTSAANKILDEVTKEGRLFPAQRSMFFDLLMKADRNTVQKFSEGGKEYQETEFARIERQLRGSPAVVKFAERMAQLFTPDPGDPELNKVREFAETNVSALKSVGKTPDQWANEFIEARKKKPSLTARDWGASA